MGSERKRSMTPELKSWLKPVPTPWAMFMPIMAMRPGMTYWTYCSWPPPSDCPMEPPKTYTNSRVKTTGNRMASNIDSGSCRIHSRLRRISAPVCRRWARSGIGVSAFAVAAAAGDRVAVLIRRPPGGLRRARRPAGHWHGGR